MIEFSLDTTVINETLVGNIARVLGSKKIPCVLWGNYLLTIYGVPSIVDSIDFVVPDELVPAAVSALQHTSLGGCTEPKTCTAVAESRPSPIPVAHFHIDSEITVSLYKKSSMLWFLPSLRLSPSPNNTAPDIILATDSRLPPPRLGRGHGAFQADCFPVCVPSAHRLLEAYIRLIARTHGRSYEYFWMAMLTYIEEYVDGDGLLDEASLEKRCRIFYQELKKCKRPVATLLEELKANLARSMD
ncbi:MAG: hypothetical protein M1834_003272 [Cirrosporium novae-zelandiae]|nr:MAG: hypothetical protein M1834_003272 [Cirrosporium novae-zelandiae]